ncbi:MAG: fibrobacter succinogenes major paralogous domain-containing protein [Fibromonadaceae bacterium]|jgi:uncharacterized protein (TIGR02145 family)|nr:fibrobacter succinogenes major paralogous domain-containing protein [Fibromonadaceae bacterium]
MKKIITVVLLLCIAAFAQQKGSFTDSRDKKTYKTVKIGEQTWMAENLNYNASGSKCYDNQPTNCDKYGRLYDWNTAKSACPGGWHLPSDGDWNVLMKFVNPSCLGNEKFCANAGAKLKATNDFGFAALPGGLGNHKGDFGDIGISTIWWSSSEMINTNNVYVRTISSSNRDDVRRGNLNKTNLFSVRCVLD